MSDRRAAVYGRDLDVDGWPTVAVVMPVRNEAPHLEQAIASILAQEYPLPFEVCLAVAPSDDDTETIAAAIASAEPRVHVVPNPRGVTPAGLNAAIGATTGEIVVRVDGHAELSPGYVRRAVETMCRTGAVNVGGMQVPNPQTPFEEAVAAATTSWFGTGGARYRVGGSEGAVDTVYLGVFDRAAGDAAGWFDEGLIRNQDYELNIRLRQAGGTVWFDPALAVGYRPRGSFRALARQYYEYGYWKAEVVRRHPDSLRPRQLIAAVAPVGVVLSIVGGGRRPMLWSGVVAYAVAALVAARQATRASRRVALGRVVAAFPTQQGAWSAGFLVGVVRSMSMRRPTDSTSPSTT